MAFTIAEGMMAIAKCEENPPQLPSMQSSWRTVAFDPATFFFATPLSSFIFLFAFP
jgi:hypothetical protein